MKFGDVWYWPEHATAAAALPTRNSPVSERRRTRRILEWQSGLTDDGAKACQAQENTAGDRCAASPSPWRSIVSPGREQQCNSMIATRRAPHGESILARSNRTAAH